MRLASSLVVPFETYSDILFTVDSKLSDPSSLRITPGPIASYPGIATFGAPVVCDKDVCCDTVDIVGGDWGFERFWEGGCGGSTEGAFIPFTFCALLGSVVAA